MARRKRKQGTSLVGLLAAALCIYFVYTLVTENLTVFIPLAGVIAAIAVVATVLLARRSRRNLFERANALIEQNADRLAKRRAQLVRQDAYGKPLLDKWHAEIDYFITEHIRPTLPIKQQSMLQDVRDEITCMIKARTEIQAQQTPIFQAFSDAMTPSEFEGFCAEQLQLTGWGAYVTPGSGDQGVDVIAEKDGVHVVLQCKLYSGSVGNAAIQEIVAGKAYEKADYCAVVTNSKYTVAAEQLAAANGVLLLHYSDLPRLETLLPRRVAVSASGNTPDLFAAVSVASAASSPSPAIESVQEQPPPFQPQRSEPINKNLLIVGGVIIIGIIATVMALLSNRHQRAVIIDNRSTIAAPARNSKNTPEFTTYSNPRFGFRIGYPRSFITKSTAENGDG